jgi:ABC-type dipeptide/oligopeptide/nickel transport system ATPase component
MHIPDGAVNLKDIKPQIKLGIQGESGTGKTYVALGFPNPVVVDTDGNLSRFAGKDIPTLPFHNIEFLESYHNGTFKARTTSINRIPNLKDAMLHFIYNDARKFEREQTLIIDSWSSIMDNVNNWYCANPVMTKTDKGDLVENLRGMYGEYKHYATIFFAGVKTLKCNVVVTFHEWKPRDKITGNLIEDKIAPLMEGSYKDQLKKHFTEFFRMVNIDGRYLMQVKPNKKFDAVTRAGIDPKALVEGVYYDVTSPKTGWDFFKENYNL